MLVKGVVTRGGKVEWAGRDRSDVEVMIKTPRRPGSPSVRSKAVMLSRLSSSRVVLFVVAVVVVVVVVVVTYLLSRELGAALEVGATVLEVAGLHSEIVCFVLKRLW
jgi:hypothetical protein